ncbi:MAG: IS66 family transposase [Culicoidibacterales bacterium]
MERLLKYQEEHMRFVTDFEVAFDNNMAARAIRMTETKMKVSGYFRSELSRDFFFYYL